MFKSAKNIIDYGHYIDDRKKTLSSINMSKIDNILKDEKFSVLPMYFAAAKKMDFDVLEYEHESIRAIVGNDANAEIVNTIISTTSKGDVWVSPRAFDMFTDAIDRDEIDGEMLTPDDAGKIAISIISLIGLEGSDAAPIKTEVKKYIKASLMFHGWTIPPLMLLIPSIESLYEEDKDYISGLKKNFGSMTIEQIAKMDENVVLKAYPQYSNYLILSKIVAIEIMEYMDKLRYDWDYLIER